jgi:hypothetical protein
LVLSRHAKNRARRYAKYGVTPEDVIQAVQQQSAPGMRGQGMALLATKIGDFRIAFVVEDRAVTIKTVIPPRRSGL